MGCNAALGAKSRSRKPNDYVGSYGKVATHDQGELVRNAGKQWQDTPDGKLEFQCDLIAE